MLKKKNKEDTNINSFIFGGKSIHMKFKLRIL